MNQNNPNNDLTHLTPELIDGYLNGTLSAEIKHKVVQYLADNPFEAEALEGLSSQHSELANDMLDLEARLSDRISTPREKKWYHRYWQVAAAILVLMVSGLTIYLLTPDNVSEVAVNQVTDEEIPKENPLSPQSGARDVASERSSAKPETTPLVSGDKNPAGISSREKQPPPEESDLDLRPDRTNEVAAVKSVPNQQLQPQNDLSGDEKEIFDNQLQQSPVPAGQSEILEETVEESLISSQAPEAAKANSFSSRKRSVSAPASGITRSLPSAHPPEHWQEYLSNNLRYPTLAKSQQTAGLVKVKFLVDTQGKPSQFEVTEKLCDQCDQEAVRVIREGPLWKPAVHDGQPVKSQAEITVEFPPVSDP